MCCESAREFPIKTHPFRLARQVRLCRKKQQLNDASRDGVQNFDLVVHGDIFLCVCVWPSVDMHLKVPSIVVGNRRFWVEERSAVDHNTRVRAYQTRVVLLLHRTWHYVTKRTAKMYHSTSRATNALTVNCAPDVLVAPVHRRKHKCQVPSLPPFVNLSFRFGIDQPSARHCSVSACRISSSVLQADGTHILG